ncbi:PREDICTED: kynurenine formamidase-like [Priapulus caudatus]|uniref:Kynurenine formamidase-like n=1 Tax=Priapulus caudatus TaxID=37621 RepID=A0ABM1EF99_PRICU|nr:PREDICTED: kynurenine formamidase-like [Priapulus caudatus]XP_014670870.1 PREDICTED: kynurenine formamidase-like [Priapulus caudatus]
MGTPAVCEILLATVLSLTVAIASANIIDLTYEYANQPDMVYWPGFQTWNTSTVLKGWTADGFYVEANTFCTAEHGGTHMDAPRHIIEGARGINEIELNEVIGDAVVVDVSRKTANDPDYQATIEDIENWEHDYGRIRPGSIFLLNTGWHRYWPDKERYLGTATSDTSLIHFPGIHETAMEWLVQNRNIKMYGVDTISLDYGQARDRPVHKILLGKNIPGLENVANLDSMPPSGARVFAIPMNIRDGTGAATRVFAVIDGATMQHASVTLITAAMAVCSLVVSSALMSPE